MSIWRKGRFAWLKVGTASSQSARLTLHIREQEIWFVQLGGERELTVYQGCELTHGLLSPHFPLL